MFKILHVAVYKAREYRGYLHGACARVCVCVCMYVATQKLVTWPLQWIIKQDFPSSADMMFIMYVCWSCICERVRGREKERMKVALATLSFPLSYFSLKERVGGGKEKSGRRISFDTSPLLREYTLLPHSVWLSVCLSFGLQQNKSCPWN